MGTASPEPRLDLHGLRRACGSCTLTELCLPMGLRFADMQCLEALVVSHDLLREGDHLFREGDSLAALYAVRGGYCKTYRIGGDGREHVLGFHMPGELMGLDAIWSTQHSCNAVTLSKASVCVLPYTALTELARKVPGLQHTILRLISRQLAQSQSLAGDHSADERVASFLISVSAGMKARGSSESQFALMMPRRDIASYLRLATATVSRVLSRFEAEGLVSLSRRKVSLLDLDRLRGLACYLPEADVHAGPRLSVTDGTLSQEAATTVL